MKLSLDADLVRSLRSKVVENVTFSKAKTAEFKFPTTKKYVKQEAFNAVCAVLDRLDMLVFHCCSLEIDSSVDGTFAFCDLLNYGQTLIDCIDCIARIYDCKGVECNDCSCFQNAGENEEGSDESYFKYLRSLCTVHPVETNRHKEYQGDHPEWCPYIGPVDSATAWGLEEQDRRADFVAIVYRNDMVLQKCVPIYLEQVFSYIKGRYNEINNVIKAVDAYNQSRLAELQAKEIQKPCSFSSYDAYLHNLNVEIQLRYHSYLTVAKQWAAIFNTHFESEAQETFLEEYKAGLRQHIARVHEALQSMECISNDSFRIDYVDKYSLHELVPYHYLLEKLSDLLPSVELQNTLCWTFDFIDDVADLAKGYGDVFYARHELKKLSDVLSNIFSFDFTQNNWHLWLQFEVAIWLLKQA